MSDNELVTMLLQRLKEQDDTLKEIKDNQSDMKGKLDSHMMMEAQVKPSIDELIAVLNGSKLIGRVVVWGCSFVGSAWVAFVWLRDHVK